MSKSASAKGLAIDALRATLADKGISFVAELVFAKLLKRRWRFDIAIPELMLAIEVEGGTWTGGRHTRGSGYEKDCEKYNTAVLLGWRVLRFTSGQVWSGYALETILKAIELANKAA